MKVYRLKEIRVKRGYTQKDIADLLNISRESYSLYERNRVDPRASTIVKLSEFYNLSADYLLGTTDKEVSLSERNKTVIRPE